MASTEQELFQAIYASKAGKIKLQQLARSIDVNSYKDFITVLYAKLTDIFVKLENSKDKHFLHDEDSITNVIAGRLEEAGYNATEQTKKNGAVDLTVNLGTYIWIAEAKIAYSKSKILEGLLQLLTRYATRDKDAGLLIYIKKRNSKKVINDWESFLKSSVQLNAFIAKKNPEVREDLQVVLNDVEIERSDRSLLNSKHTMVSGSPILVQHFCADLYFNPTDVSGNNAKIQRESNALNNLANLYFEHLESTSEFDSEKCLEYLERLFREIDFDDIKQS